MGTPCRNGGKQFPSVAWRPSVIFMSHTHTQVKASPALQILRGPSVMSSQRHTTRWLGCGLFCPSRTGCLHKWLLILLHLTSMTFTHRLSVLCALCPVSESHGKARLTLSIPSFLFCFPSCFPPALLDSPYKYLLCPPTMVSPMIPRL